MQTKWNYFWRRHKDVWITYFCRSNWNITWMGETSRKNNCMVLWYGRTRQKVCGKILWTGKQKNEQLHKVSSPCLDDHQFKKEELETVGDLAEVCSQIVLKCLYLARIGGPDIPWSVNKLARAVTKWTRSCDRRSARLISYIHHTQDCRHYSHVGNTAQHCRLGLFQYSDFAGDLEDSKINLGRNFMFAWKWNIRSCELDLQKTNISISWLYRIRNHFSGRWTKDGWSSCIRSLGHCNSNSD